MREDIACKIPVNQYLYFYRLIIMGSENCVLCSHVAYSVFSLKSTCAHAINLKGADLSGIGTHGLFDKIPSLQ